VQADDHPVVTPGNTTVVLPGIMTMNDLRAYTARVQAPTHVRYRGLDIYSMAPPSSGGSTVGEALNILSGYDLSAEPRATALFHYLEASRPSYADRNAYVGDPRYVSVPLSSQLGEQFTEATGPILPLDNYPGDATALAVLGGGRLEPIAEPVRLGGGSALVVNPSP
jgi:gamma-glutamyltranspeptidase